MSTKEVKKEEQQEVKPKIDREELKRKIRRATLEYSGRLAIDDKYKKPGKILRIDNDDLATRKQLELLGYSVVLDEVQVGSGSLSEPNNMGSAVHIEQGIRMSQPGILYEIDEELWKVRKEIEAEDNDAQLAQTIVDNQRDDQRDKRIGLK